MMSRAAVFLSVLTVSLTQPAFPYVWAAESATEPPTATSPLAQRLQQDLRFHALQSVVRNRSGEITMSARARAESRIEAEARRVDRRASQDPKGVMKRVAREFGIEPGDLMRQKKQLGAWWSEVVIVQTILANVPAGLQADELLLLRKKGSSWSEIAYGLGFELHDFVEATRIQCRVAAGLEAADGAIEKLERQADAPPLWGDVSWLPGPETSSTGPRD